MMPDLIEIDGSYGEGGGQIIRTSASLSAMTGKPVEIRNVRAGRSKPGLQRQHLTAVRAAAELCGAEVTGADVGASSFRFTPAHPLRAGEYRFDIGTAGATALVAQTVLVPLCHAEGTSRVVITGGTHVPHAPPAEYLATVYVPALRRAGLDLGASYRMSGFFPRGGGRLELETAPAPYTLPLDLTERGKLTSLRAFIVTANLPDHVADRGAAAVEQAMKAVGRKVEIEKPAHQSPSTGAAVVLAAECENGYGAFTGLGERGKPIEKVAEEPCRDFMRWWKSGAAVDEHLADQLVLPLCFAHAESRWTTPEVTEHLRTVIWLVRHFLPIEATLDEPPDAPATVTLARP
jgi:RNA 3'-terminal phosphate cyclase (ATP)